MIALRSSASTSAAVGAELVSESPAAPLLTICGPRDINLRLRK